ncbi:MAG: IST3 family protein, partial [Cytophagales bacterium]|nr:IST3 family protein [Cytophagales bacterium]
MNTVREIQRLNKQEAEEGITGEHSWHHQYRHTAWVYVGGLPYEMTEGDVLCFFSQVGEIEKLDMKRDPETGKFRGFCFIKYEDQRSTILAVDNFTGVTFAGRIIKVDHKSYNPPTKKKKRKRGEEVDSSEEENENRELEERKALTDVRWENDEYRSKANLEPKKKKRKLSKEEKKAKKEKKLAKKLKKQAKKEKREMKKKEQQDKDTSIPTSTTHHTDRHNTANSQDSTESRSHRHSHDREEDDHYSKKERESDRGHEDTRRERYRDRASDRHERYD